MIGAVEQMPRLLGQQRAVTSSSIELPLRVLAHVHPDADELWATCVALVRRAIELYLSEVDELVLRSHDAELGNDPEAIAPLLDRAASLVSTDFPNPFAGGASGQSTWSLNINVPQVRKYRGVRTLSDYLARQAEVLADMRPNRGVGQPPVLPSSVFGIMPFGTEWSAGVYDLVKRAAESLQPELDVLVYRADEISRPGKITDQIVQAIAASDAIIADITGNNPNVMWELGFAQALGKPAVILNQSVHDAPFDLRDWRQLVYGRTPTDTDARKLAEYLREAVEGT